MEKKMIKTFEEKKEYAVLMRNIFGITAVLYIGFIIWIACIHRYEILWWAFNVWLLLVCLAVKNQGEKVDAELVLKYIEYVESRDELIEAISRNHPWISVKERLPEDNKVVLLWLGGCYKVALLRDKQWWECTGWQIGGGWSALDALSTREVEYITHWMPVPEV